MNLSSKRKNKICYVYVLKDPDTSEVMYVGQSINPEQRYKSHKGTLCSDTTRKAAWVRSLRVQNKEPAFEVIDKTTDDKIDDLEMAWIWYYALQNERLVNGAVYPPAKEFSHIKYPDIDRCLLFSRLRKIPLRGQIRLGGVLMNRVLVDFSDKQYERIRETGLPISELAIRAIDKYLRDKSNEW